ncbi:hypothetical protein [Nitrosospira lacus]|nr:hypothetical protein [Nitrosospira lacus]
MKTRLGTFVAVLSMLGLLASCAQMGPLEAQNDTSRRAAQHARTYADHNNLARQYENTAKEIRVKAEEQKKLLQHYEEKSYLYGRQAQDFQSRTWALVNKYEQAAEENIRQAAFHQKMASELAKRDYATPMETPGQQNRENKARIGSDPKDRI